MSNFSILENGPVASPAACGICGYSGSDRLFLDPRKDFEFYGSFIICEPCVGAMSNDFGFLQPAQVLSLETRIEEAERELTILREAVLHLEKFNDAIAGLDSLRGAFGDGGVGTSNDTGEQETPESNASGVTKPQPESAVGEQEAGDNVSVEGPDDVSVTEPGVGAFGQPVISL